MWTTARPHGASGHPSFAGPSADVEADGSRRAPNTANGHGLAQQDVLTAADAIADAIFKDAAVGKDLTDNHLSSLALLFQEKHVAKALEIVEAGGVRRFVAERSGREVYQVAGHARGESYTCLPRSCCSCQAFFFDVIGRGDALLCKHQLAARLSAPLGRCPPESVPDVSVALLLAA